MQPLDIQPRVRKAWPRVRIQDDHPNTKQRGDIQFYDDFRDLPFVSSQGIHGPGSKSGAFDPPWLKDTVGIITKTTVMELGPYFFAHTQMNSAHMWLFPCEHLLLASDLQRSDKGGMCPACLHCTKSAANGRS